MLNFIYETRIENASVHKNFAEIDQLKIFFSINSKTFFCFEATNWDDVSGLNWSTKKHSTSSISSTKKNSSMKKQKSDKKLTLIECFFDFSRFRLTDDADVEMTN